MWAEQHIFSKHRIPNGILVWGGDTTISTNIWSLRDIKFVDFVMEDDDAISARVPCCSRIGYQHIIDIGVSND